MNTSHTSTKTEKHDYWTRHVKQYMSSGKTQRDYCDQHQLKLHQLVYWKRVLMDQFEDTNTDRATNGFVAVQLTQPLDRAAEQLIIELPNGVRIKGVHANNLTIIQDIIRWQS